MKKALSLILLIVLLGFGTYSYAGNTATSGVSVQTIIDRVRIDVAEANADFWADADFIQWTNEAVREIVNQTRCLETGVSTIVLYPFGRSYSLSALSWIDVEKVEYDSGVTWIHSSGTTRFNPLYIYDLDRVPFIKLRQGNEKETGTPKVFAVWNNSLYVWPMPDTTQAGTTCYAYYVPLPSGVTSAASSIETPSYFDSAILDYVRGKAWYKAEYVKRGEYFMKLFYAKIQTYLVNIMRRNVFELPQPQK